MKVLTSKPIVKRKRSIKKTNKWLDSVANYNKFLEEKGIDGSSDLQLHQEKEEIEAKIASEVEKRLAQEMAAMKMKYGITD